ncbi:MAG: hypothetical protein CSA58_04625, partial [Micrococcales bacterium]
AVLASGMLLSEEVEMAVDMAMDEEYLEGEGYEQNRWLDNALTVHAQLPGSVSGEFAAIIRDFVRHDDLELTKAQRRSVDALSFDSPRTSPDASVQERADLVAGYLGAAQRYRQMCFPDGI